MSHPLRRAALAAVAALIAASVLAIPRAAHADTMLGLFPSNNNTTLLNLASGPTIGDSRDYLSAMEAWQGRPNAIVNVYWQLGNDNSSTDDLFGTWLPQIWDAHKAVPMISLNINPYTSAGIKNGGNATANTHIDQFAASLHAFVDGAGAPVGGRRVYIRLNWEPNAYFAAYSPTKGATCNNFATRLSDYKAAWRFVHDRIMNGAGGFTHDQVQWVYSVYFESVVPGAITGSTSTCKDRVKTLIADAYPDDGTSAPVVDWLGVDGYPHTQTGPSLQPPAGVFDDALHQLDQLPGDKPVGVNEVSAGTPSGLTPADKDAWVASYLAYVKAKTAPAVKMSLWFSSDYSGNDFAIFSQDGLTTDGLSDGTCTYVTTVTYNAYCAYASGIADPLFVSADGTNPRLLTDAQFEGT